MHNGVWGMVLTIPPTGRNLRLFVSVPNLPSGFFLGGFFDTDNPNENYYKANDDGTLKRITRGGTFATAFGQSSSPIKSVFEAMGLSTDDYNNLMNAHFTIDGTEIYLAAASKKALTLDKAAMTMGDLTGYKGNTNDKFGSLAAIFANRVWQLTSSGSSLTFTTTEDTYVFDETNNKWGVTLTE